MPLPMYDKKTSPAKESSIRSILAIAAGKGGVGKSTVTVNLALALQALGYRVGIMDTDLYGPSLRRMLPEDRMPEQHGDRITPAISFNMPIISMAYFRREEEAAVVRAPIANGIIMQFISQVEWGDLDFLLIDFPPGTGDIQLTLSQKASITGAIMVTTPQDVAVMDVRKAMNMFEQVNIPIVGVVENMSFFTDEASGTVTHIFGKDGGKRLAEEAAVPFLGEVPLSPKLCQCGDNGTSIFDASDDDPCRDAFLSIADAVVRTTSLMASQKSTQSLSVNNLWQIDNYTFGIEWSDGITSEFRFKDIQRRCPCAGCEEKRLHTPLDVDEDVRALSLKNVGNYALSLQFTSGCSAGIYGFDLLRSITKESV